MRKLASIFEEIVKYDDSQLTSEEFNAAVDLESSLLDHLDEYTYALDDKDFWHLWDCFMYQYAVSENL